MKVSSFIGKLRQVMGQCDAEGGAGAVILNCVMPLVTWIAFDTCARTACRNS